MQRNVILVVFFLTVMAHPAWGQMVTGMVFSVTDQEIEILVPSGKTIEMGTPVELWAKTPDGNEISVGTWAISRCEICLAYARAVEPTGTPTMGQKALIGRPAEPAPLVPPVQPVVPVVNPPRDDPNQPEQVTPPVNPMLTTFAKSDPLAPDAPVVKPPEVVAPPVTPPVTPPVSPPVAPPVTPQPQAPTQAKPENKLSASDQRLMADLTSNQGARIRNAAKYLYRGRYQSPMLMDQAAQVLQEQCNKSTTDRYHPDAMAWICKALWASGESKYIEVLKAVEKKATSEKLRKYAAKYGQSLRQKSGER